MIMSNGQIVISCNVDTVASIQRISQQKIKNKK